MGNKDAMVRMLLFMVLGVVVVLAVQHFTKRDDTAPPTGADSAVSTVDATGSGDASASLSGVGSTVRFEFGDQAADAGEADAPIVLGRAAKGGSFAMAVTVSPRGAGIRRLQLSDYYASVEDRKLSDEQREHFQLVQQDVGRVGFVLTRLDLSYADGRPGEAVPLDMPIELQTPLERLNGGAGVHLGSIEVYDHHLDTGAKIHLTGCRTVQDVVGRINANGYVPVTASLSPTGRGLVLVGAKDAELSVNEVGDGTAAADLGILQPKPLDSGVTLVGGLLGCEPAWELDGAPSAGQVRLKLVVRREGEPLLTLYRTFRLTQRTAGDDDLFGDGTAFLMGMDIEVVDHSGQLSSCAMTMRGPEGLVKEEARGDGRMAVGGYIDKDRSAEFKSGGDAKAALEPKGAKHKFTAPLDWAGMVDKYFALVATPANLEQLAGRFEYAAAYPAYTDAKGDKVPGIVMRTHPIRFGLQDGQSRLTAQYFVYAGPKDANLLEKPLFRDRNLAEVISYSRGCCVDIPGVAFISKAMVWAIDQIARVVANKGLAVILLVILVRLLMLPVTRYSQLSMLRMQELQPEIAKLKEQFSDDQKRVQMETMKLYRERGANPMLGCVPMMLQMPVWIALYTGIQVAISLRHAPFLLWIQDLAQPDCLVRFAPVDIWGVSFIGGWADWQLNILPLLVLVSMFLQMKMQPQSAATSPEMARQQQMMKFMMPAMLLIFLYTAPSALNLYIAVSSTIGYFEGKYIRWHHAQLKLKPQKPRKEKKQGPIGRWIESQMGQVERLQKAAKKSDNPFEKRKPRK
ncbi:MAG: YidC/Oxa1 family insertase periplasmic-domain containing protein [Planctomycetes bacterium]|nr:YidC/Oxa1 family insertase periplasmic-domain containing protein [Planctomycetota bacterium]